MFRRVLQKVFSNPRYLLLNIGVSVSVFAFAVWLPNWKLILSVVTSSSVTFIESIKVILSLFLSIGTNFTVLSASYTIIIAILFGLNVSLLTYYIIMNKSSFGGKGGVLSIGGLISGVFGIGCAACGTFVLTSVLALIGAGGIIAFLPFGGTEFGIVGVLLVGYGTYWTIKKIDKPTVCEIQ